MPIPDGPIGEQEVLDALGLAGNLETARLLEQIGGGDTAAALETLARLYGAGKEVGSLLGELSALVRDLLVRKTAPKGGAALLTGGYDESTMRRLSNLFQTQRLAQMLGLLQTTIAELSRSNNRRTDAELCLIRLCDPALDESLAGINAPPQKMPTEEDRPPWEEERPPLPEEPGEPVDRMEKPGPAPQQPAREQPANAAAPAGDIWPGLVAGLRGKFPAVYPFLSNPAAVRGVLEDAVLTLWVDTEFTKNMVGATAVLETLGQLAGAQTGRPVRCLVKVGTPPKSAKTPAAPAEHDNLDDLLAMGQQFDNIIIQE